MQKLVKKTLHYETIMPVEAYHEEDNNDDWTDDLVSIGFGVLGAVTGFVTRNPWVGVAVAGAGIGYTVANNEEMMESINEGINAQTEADLLMADAMINTAGAIANTVGEAYNAGAEAITDAYIDWYYDDELAEEIKNRKGGG